MRYIRTENNYVEFIEASNDGNILSSRGFQFGELYFKIQNSKVTFYLNDQENPWRNDVWTIDIPFELDGVVYDNEDDASAALHNIMNDRFQEQLDQLKEDLAAETARAQQAEEDLGEEIDDERDRAISAETHLQTEVTELSGLVSTFDERITNVEESVSALTDDLNDEIARSTAKDAEHDAQISALTNTINSEIQRALAAESGITENLNAEISRSTSKDAQHDVQISALTTNLQNEIQRATEAENSLRSDLNDEIADRISGDTNLQNQIDAEAARATAAESALTNNLNAEILRSTTKDTQHDSQISGLTSDLATEVQNRINADNALQTNLTNEVTRATSAETVLHNEIISERDRAIAAESGITSALNSEITRSTNKDIELNNKIDGEIARATGVEATKADKANAVASAEYVRANKIINFKNINGAVISSIDATDFIKDGMVDDVEIKVISGASYLAVTFNSDSGKEEIDIPLTDIFNPNNYYTKSEIDASQLVQDNKIATLSGDVNTLETKIETVSGAVTSITADLTNYYTKSQVDASQLVQDNKITALSGNVTNLETKIDAISGNSYTKNEVDNKLANKADLSALTAHISDDVRHITAAERTAWNNKSDFSGSYNDLTDKPTIPTVPTNVSAFVNDAGYITSAYTYDKATIDQKVASGGTFDPTQYYTTANTYNKTEVNNLLSGKADPYSAGTGISIVGNVISATGGGTVDAYTKAESDAKYATIANFNSHSGNTEIHFTTGDVQTQINNSISGKTIDSLSAGTGIDITNNVISATGGSVEYSAGTNVQISNHIISATDTKYTAGDGISISNSNVISTVTKFWCGTQAQYDLITVKDPNTVYMIHE